MKKYKDILFFTIFFVIGFFIFKFQGMISQDCLYNFGFANQLYNGHIPYKDFNLVITPLFAYIMAPFSPNFSTFILFSSLFQALMFSIIMRNIRNLVAKLICAIFICLKLWIFPFIDYNMFMIFFLILSCLQLLKYQESMSWKNLFGVGLCLSLALCSKQSLPGVIILILTPILLIFCIKKKQIKDFIFYGIGGCLPVAIICMIAIGNNTFMDMIDYILFGVGSFSELATTQSISIAFILSSILVISVIFVILASYDIKNGLLSLVYILPIFIILILKDDRTALFAVIYVLSIYFMFPPAETLKNLKINRMLKNIVFVLLGFVLFIVALRFSMTGIGYHQMVENTSYVKTNEYEWINNEKIPDYLLEYIKDIDKYIKENEDKKILPVSAFTKLYSLSVNKTYGVFELLVDGNMGVKNFENVPNILEEYDLLLVANVNMLMQYDGIYKYIEENYELYEEIPIAGITGYVYQVK